MFKSSISSGVRLSFTNRLIGIVPPSARAQVSHCSKELRSSSENSVRSLSFAGSPMHGFLNLIGKTAQMHSQSIEQFPFRFVRSEVSDPGAIGCVPAELFQMGLIILHGAPRLLFRRL